MFVTCLLTCESSIGGDSNALSVTRDSRSRLDLHDRISLIVDIDEACLLLQNMLALSLTALILTISQHQTGRESQQHLVIV